jgi:hypothetical protein
MPHLELFIIFLCAPGVAAELETSATEILQRRCLSCHGAKVKMGKLDLSKREAAVAGGMRGAALTPGSRTASLLWERVDKGQMPPSAPLPVEERRTLREWIEAGAPWSSAIVETRAGSDWWSFQPLRTTTPPDAPQRWARTPIDRWIYAGLQKAGLSPSPKADRRALIRGLSFDLLGLPPDPATVEAFVADSRPDAYERLVDKMLASPHYGERWARHWLDLARFAESEGFERDQLRENVWKYRDYVIRSLNADKPYAQFAREQIAGDVIDKATHDSMLATALLTMGPTDAIGLTSAVASEREAVREDMLEEMLGVVVPRPYARWTFDVDARNDTAGLHGRLTANMRIDGGVLAPGERSRPSPSQPQRWKRRSAKRRWRLGSASERRPRRRLPSSNSAIAAGFAGRASTGFSLPRG